MELREKLKNTDRCAYISATGTGKSYVGGKLIEDEGYKALILVPSEEIRKGWKEILPMVSVEAYYGLHKADLAGVDLLICDEMHHLGAEVWGRNFNGLVDGFNGKILGMTATPVRFLDNGRNMVDELFGGEQVTGVELPEAIEKGLLPAFDYITALYNLPAYMPGEDFRNETTEKLYAKLDAMSNSYSFQNILLKHMAKGNHKVVVFVSRIDEIPSMMKIVKDAFPQAGHFQAHSDMTDGDRKLSIKAFRSSRKTAFLYTVDLLNEGVHIPGVDTVIMFRRTQSPNVYLQQLGRALSSDMKGRRVQIFDFVANHDNLKTCLGAGTSVIDWIRDGISNPQRQIIVQDYAMEEWELIRKLRDQIFRLWDSPDKRAKFYQDIRELYLTEGGLEKLQGMYPDLRRNYIQTVAYHLGLVEKVHSKLTKEAKEFIAAHPEMKSEEVALELPGFSLYQVRTYRNKLGYYDKKVVWTTERDQRILENIDLPARKIRDLYFPDLSVTTVHNRKKSLGWKAQEKEEWPEDKIQRFSDLYIHGGTRWVQQDPEFLHMSSHRIGQVAERFHLKRDGRPINFNWSREETLILEEELRKPKVARLSFEEIASLMPRHSPLAVKRRMKRMMDKKDTWLK